MFRPFKGEIRTTIPRGTFVVPIDWDARASQTITRVRAFVVEADSNEQAVARTHEFLEAMTAYRKAKKRIRR